MQHPALDASPATILVIAHPDDAVTARFVAYAERSGVQCTWLTRDTKVGFSARCDRDGHVEVDIHALRDRVRVRAVLNRGLPFYNVSQFEDLETIGGWWSALASFPGPVVNRPSHLGFLPEIQALALCKEVPQLKMGKAFFSSHPKLENGTATINIHAADDGRFIGSTRSQTFALNGSERRTYLCTEFSPGETIRLLLAGDRLFSLQACAQDPHLKCAAIQAAKAELQSRNATFSMFVIQRSNTDELLLYATPLPGLQAYQQIESDVHEAVLDFLLR